MAEDREGRDRGRWEGSETGTDGMRETGAYGRGETGVDGRTIEGLRAKRAYIDFWPIFIFCRIELIFGRLTCFDMKSIVP